MPHTLAEFPWEFHPSGSPKAQESRDLSYREKLDTGIREEKVMIRSCITGGTQVT